MRVLIDKQDAIDTLSVGKEILNRVLDETDVVGTEREKFSFGLGLIESAIKDIEELPSAKPDLPIKEKCAYCPHCENCDVNDDLSIAQPEIVRCKDCKYRMPYDWMFSEIWRSQNINDYSEDEIGCGYCDMAMRADDFCSRAERRMERNE